MRDFDAKGHWEAVLTEEAGLAGVGYRGIGERFNRWMYRARRPTARRALRSALAQAPTREVLDIGSGTGFYVELWHAAGAAHVTGLDLTDTVVQRLRARHPGDRFERADIGGEREALPAQRFGAVSAIDVLFHIVDDDRYRRAFANVAALLEPRGLFVFSENFLHGETVRTEDQASRPLAEIEAILDENGFEVLSRRPMFFLMNEPVDSRSAAHRAFWWRLTGQLKARGPRAQWTIGAALYPLERAALAIMREGPSTELMVCRKRP